MEKWLEESTEELLAYRIAVIRDDQKTAMAAGQIGQNGHGIGPMNVDNVGREAPNLSDHAWAKGSRSQHQPRRDARDRHLIKHFLLRVPIVARHDYTQIQGLP